LAVAFLDILGLVAILGVCGGMLYLANRIEPHWVAKDGRRFMTVAQDMDQFGLPTGRKREVRVHLEPGEEALFIRGRSMIRPSSGIWMVHAKSPKPPRGRVVYILKKISGNSDVDTMMLRFPGKSRMIEQMDELLAASEGSSRTPPPSPPADPS
jgi:hypothetical protein